MLGTQDLIIGLVLAAFFFGAKRLPEIARSLGKSMQEFKKGVSGDTGEEASSKTAEPGASGASDRFADMPVLPEPARAGLEALPALRGLH